MMYVYQELLTITSLTFRRSIYALRALLNALSPLIGAEDELGGKAVLPGWANNASKDKVQEWSERGIELVKEEMERIAEETCAVEYGRLMHKVRFPASQYAYVML